MTEYRILNFNEDNAQLVIEVPELEATFAIDLPVDDEGNVPFGSDLDKYIRGFIPQFEIDRRKRVKEKGVKNKDLLKALVEQNNPTPEEKEEEEAEEKVPSFITLSQLRAGLVLAEWISREEAVAWRKGDELPAPVQAVIDELPEEQRFLAEEKAFSSSTIGRDSSMVKNAARVAMPDASDEEIEAALDQSFIEWSKL